MGEVLKKAVKHNWVFWICLCVSIFLIVGGAIVPPPFVIDSSIFVAVGELFGFASLGVLSKAIDKGLDARVKHNNTEITVGSLEDNHTQNNAEEIQ